MLDTFRDLHPDNVLLDEDGHVLLTYFGAREDVESQLHDQAIENFYCAPGKRLCILLSKIW